MPTPAQCAMASQSSALASQRAVLAQAYRAALLNVPALSTPVARSAPPDRCPGPTRALPTVHHSSAPLLPSGALACCKALSVCVCVLAFVAVSGSLIYIYRVYFPCVRQHRTMPCHGTRYTPSMRTRVPSFVRFLGRPSLIKLVLVKDSYFFHLIFSQSIKQLR